MMERASRGVRSWIRKSLRPVWSRLDGRLGPRCAYAECSVVRRAWRRKAAGVRMRGMEYCRTECLELALIDILGQAQFATPREDPVSHRIPLGLLLLSRQQLSAEDLRAALEAQKKALGEGKVKKIGAWLQEFGFASEAQITAALARQWACPVLRSAPMDVAAYRFPSIPVVLLHSYQMFPVEMVETTATLLMAFSERIDYTVLYAIELMLGCRTQACVLSPSIMRKSLELVGQRAVADAVFDRVKSSAECARIIGSYAAKVSAEEVRMARCGNHLWIRLERLSQEAVTLLLRTP